MTTRIDRFNFQHPKHSGPQQKKCLIASYTLNLIPPVPAIHGSQKTWLRTSIFLENYNVYRDDRITTETIKSRHGGVFTALKNYIAHELLSMKCLKSDYLVMKIKLHGRPFILCCIYIEPSRSSYQWTSNEFLKLMQEIENMKSADERDPCDIKIAGDINFSQTNWETLSSPNIYETQILEGIVEQKLT